MSDERAARLAEVARRYEVVADELERAAAHCRRAAEHFRAGEVPRGAAHAWAGYGHVRGATDALHELARTHAERSNV